MPLFRRAKKSDGHAAATRVPPWCSWFTPEQWQAFQALLNDVFLDGSTSGPPLVLGTDQVLRLGAEGEPGIELDLAALASLLREVPRPNWRTETVTYVREQLRVRDLREELYAAPFDRIRHRLLPRVVRTDPERDEGVLPAHELTEELSVVLVVRLEGDLSSAVRPAQLARWGADADEAWSAALANLANEVVSTGNDGQDNPMVAVTGEDGFSCSQLLRAAEVLGRPAPHGILAMAPHEGSLHLQAVDGPELKWAVIGYSSVVESMWADVPPRDRLSSRLLWIHDGAIEAVDVEPAAPGSREPGVISGSERFIALLSSFHPPSDAA